MNPSGNGHERTRELFEAFERTEPGLRRALAALGVLAVDADDVMQSALLRGMQSPPKWHGPLAAERWWRRVALNQCLLEFRRARRDKLGRERWQQQYPAGAADSPSRPLPQQSEAERIRAALAEMEDALAIPLVLRYWFDMDSNEIGEVLDTPAATIRTRLRAARLALADALGGGDDDGAA